MARVDICVSTTILGRKGKMTLETDSVRNALNNVVERSGTKLKNRIFDDQGRLSEFIDVFVNGRNIDLLDGLQTKLRDGDRIDILRVVSGG